MTRPGHLFHATPDGEQSVKGRAEERDLLLRYGEAYEEYRRRAGIFGPR